MKKMFLEISQNSQENTCARASFLIKLQAEVFSCEFCVISKNKFSNRTPPVAAFERALTDLPTDERLQYKRFRIVREEEAQKWSLPK